MQNRHRPCAAGSALFSPIRKGNAIAAFSPTQSLRADDAAPPRARPRLPGAALLSRIVAALLGGYALAALSSVALLALPIPATEAVIAGMLVSFLVYCGAVVWVFAVRSARRAWAGLALAAVPLLIASALVWTGMGAP